MAVRLQIRNGTASEWASANPLLMEGELAIENDTKKVKIGDGINNWNSLSYMTQGLKGEQGDAFVYADFTPEQLEGLRGPTGLPGSIDNMNGLIHFYRENLETITGTINLNLANVFYRNATANTTFNIINAVNNEAHSFTLIIDMGATVRTLSFPGSVKWQGGEIPDMTTANKTYLLTFLSVTGGVIWLGMFGGEF